MKVKKKKKKKKPHQMASLLLGRIRDNASIVQRIEGGVKMDFCDSCNTQWGPPTNMPFTQGRVIQQWVRAGWEILSWTPGPRGAPKVKHQRNQPFFVADTHRNDYQIRLGGKSNKLLSGKKINKNKKIIALYHTQPTRK